jgi:hypothetical protein
MAQYLILIYEGEGGYADATAAERQEIMAAHLRFHRQVDGMAAKVLGGQALEPASMATSVRGDVITDGPFVRTRENIAGFYLIEADGVDQALAVAKLVPAGSGGAEVRPIMDASA